MPILLEAASLKESAEAGDAQAMCEWGVALGRGDGVARDPLESARWMQKSADAGNAMAMLYLGIYYRSGEGVPQNSDLSRKWLLKSAKAELPEAQLELAMHCLRGDNGFAVDLPQSREWAREAAEKGLAAGQYLYGILLIDGRGGAADMTGGLEWLERAARAGDIQACETMSELYAASVEKFGKPRARAIAWTAVAALKSEKAKTTLKTLEAVATKEEVAEAQAYRDEILDTSSFSAVMEKKFPTDTYHPPTPRDHDTQPPHR